MGRAIRDRIEGDMSMEAWREMQHLVPKSIQDDVWDRSTNLLVLAESDVRNVLGPAMNAWGAHARPH